MKKTISLLLFCLFLLNTSSCTENELVHFDTGIKPMLNIWFGPDDLRFNSLTHNFSHFVSEKTAVPFVFRITGFPADYPRTFTLEVVHVGDYDKVSFEIGEFVLGAGEYRGSGTFFIINNVDNTLFADSSGHVELRLKPNDIFDEGTIQRNRLRITLQNGLVRPADWYTPFSSFFWSLSHFFGSYSRVKHGLIVEVTGMPAFKVVRTGAGGGITPGDIIGGEPVISNQQAQTFQRRVSDALTAINQERAARGEPPLTDEFGEIVTIPS